MGLLKFLGLDNNNTTFGYKRFDNPFGWDNAEMLNLLSSVNTPFGAPKMGWIRAFGKEREVVVFDKAHDVNYLYVDAQPGKIVVSMAPKPGQIGGPKDHVLAEDVIEKDYDTWNATMSAVEPAEELIKIVQGLLAT